MAHPRPKATLFHCRVREQLRQQIASGQYMPGMRLPPEKELFKQLRASSTTVVRALNELVREGLIVRRRGWGTYVAERENPPLIPGRPLKLGILWWHGVRASGLNDFCGCITHGALNAWGVEGTQPEFDEDRARTYTRATWRQPARGLMVECLGNEMGGYQRAPSLEAVSKAGYDAVISVGIIEEKWLSSLLDLGLPVVIVDFPTQRLGARADLVYADPQVGYRSAVDHFIERGLRRIHFIGTKVWDPNVRIPDATQRDGYRFGKRVDPDTFLRLSAYRQALDAHGIDSPAGWVHFQTNEEDQKMAVQLAALAEADRPQALLCHDIGRAEGLMRACAELGLWVEAAGASPDAHASPALSIRLNVQEMGSVAGELLLARLKKADRPFLNVGVRMVLVAPTGAGHPPVAAGMAPLHVRAPGPVT